MESEAHQDSVALAKTLGLKPLNLIVIGRSSAGKSTWINSFINYLAGRQYKDKRVVAITQSCSIGSERKVLKCTIPEFEGLQSESLKGQFEAQTTSYNLYRVKSKTHLVSIMDTPGLSDPDPKKDDEYIQSIAQAACLFKEIHAVVYVHKSSDIRITPEMEKFMMSYMSVLPEQVMKSHLVVCFTHVNSKKTDPESVESLTKAKLMTANTPRFLFQNDAWMPAEFKNIPINDPDDDDLVAALRFWKANAASYSEFMKKVDTFGLVSTEGIYRKQLTKELCVKYGQLQFEELLKLARNHLQCKEKIGERNKQLATVCSIEGDITFQFTLVNRKTKKNLITFENIPLDEPKFFCGDCLKYCRFEDTEIKIADEMSEVRDSQRKWDIAIFGCSIVATVGYWVVGSVGNMVNSYCHKIWAKNAGEEVIAKCCGHRCSDHQKTYSERKPKVEYSNDDETCIEKGEKEFEECNPQEKEAMEMALESFKAALNCLDKDAKDALSQIRSILQNLLWLKGWYGLSNALVTREKLDNWLGATAKSLLDAKDSLNVEVLHACKLVTTKFNELESAPIQRNDKSNESIAFINHQIESDLTANIYPQRRQWMTKFRVHSLV